jgi:hypothetical protein
MTSDDVLGVSVVDGDVLIATAAEAVIKTPAKVGPLLRPVAPPPIYCGAGVTSSATPIVLAPRLHLAEGEAARGRMSVVGRRAGDMGERFTVDLILAAYRPIGGTVTLQVAAASQPVGLSETTSSMDAVIVADTAAQTLGVQVTGLASTIMEWTAVCTDLLRTSEIRNAA